MVFTTKYTKKQQRTKYAGKSTPVTYQFAAGGVIDDEPETFGSAFSKAFKKTKINDPQPMKAVEPAKPVEGPVKPAYEDD